MAISNPATAHAQDPVGNSAAVEEEHRQLESLARDWIEGLKASGETAGIAAFPPPGTNPTKTGLVVPDSFESPEGYVRHYQITDDGKRLEPILMFSPELPLIRSQPTPPATSPPPTSPVRRSRGRKAASEEPCTD